MDAHLNPNANLSLATGCLAVLLASSVVDAGAQQAKDEEGVVVSATRVPRSILDVPASVDRVYSEDIRDGRPQANLSESLGRVPGIFVQNRQNYAQDLQISSRGFGARSTFGVRGIRLYADGIPATMPDGQGQAATFALGSAESIEVLRGPFSSMYGNAAGGVISITTEDGPLVPTLDAGLYVGSYGFQREAVKLGGQSGAVNYLLDASKLDSNGYRDHSSVERTHFNGKLRIALGESTGLTILVNDLRQPQTQDPLGLTRAQVGDNPRQAGTGAQQFNTRKTIIQDQVGATLNHSFDGGGKLQATMYGGQRYVEQYLAIPLTPQAQLSPTSSGGVVNLDRGYGGVALRYSRETTLAGRPFTLAIGAERDVQDERRRGFLNLNGSPGSLKRDEDDTVANTDAYAQAEWKFAERWSASAGVRTTHVHFHSADHFIAPGNGDDTGSRTYTDTTPVAGIVYRLTPQVSLYGNFGRGFETPTFAEIAYRSTTSSGLNFGLQAGRSRHVEAGVKAIVPGTGRATLALFDVDTHDEIVTDQNSGGRSTFKNAGRTSRTGIEMSAETLLPGSLQALASYTYLDATFRDAFVTATGTPSVQLPVAAGNWLPGTPRSQFYGEVRWKHAASGFHTSLETLYRSRVAVNDVNSEFANSYTTANAVGGFTQLGAQWKLTEFLRVDNLSSRKYVGSVIVNEANGRYYEPAPQRNVLLGLQATLEY